MKNRKTILFLMLAILAMATAEVWLNVGERRDRRVRLAARRSALADDAESATTIVLARRGEPETRLDLDGDTWRMTHPFAADVEQSVVLKLLDVLSQATVSATMTDAELRKIGRTRADYLLENPSLRVTLTNATSRCVLSFGTLTSSGEEVYVSRDGEAAVLIVPLRVLAAVDLPVDQLRRRRIFDWDADSVTAFDVRQSPGAILSFEREKDGWRVGAGADKDEGKASSAVVAKFLSGMATAEAQGFVNPADSTNKNEKVSTSRLATYGLDPETSVTVTFKRLGGLNDSISFGKGADEKSVYALVHNGGSVVKVSAALKDAALQDVASFADARLFTAAAEDVASFSLAEGGTTLAFSRLGQGFWRMDAPIAAPADADAVSLLLSRILALTSADLDANGAAVALGGDAKPVSVARLALFPEGGGFERFRSKEIVRFSEGEIRRIVSSTGTNDAANVSVVYEREGKAWNVEKAPEGAVVSEAGVARVLAALAPLRAVRVERLKVTAAELAKYGLENPSWRLAVDPDREGAVRRNILVGAKTEGGSFATVGAADAVFVIPPAAVEALSSPLVETRR